MDLGEGSALPDYRPRVIGAVLAEAPVLRVLLLLVLAIWSFCRAYYFAFYVLEHYIDPSFRFSGLVAAVCYLWSRNSEK
jgi:hypothetical protein